MNLNHGVFFMTNWRSRTAVNTTWKTHDRVSQTSWNKRNTNDTTWEEDRKEHWYKSRKYMLGSFFELLLTAITDPKDWKAIRLKSDPPYQSDPEYDTRRVWNPVWHYNRI